MPFDSEPLTESGLPIRSRPKQKRQRSIVHITSPIAEDGGFGQMDYDDSEEENNDAIEVPKHDEERGEPIDNDRASGDDFDDFEAGAVDDDFGDFDEGDEPEPAKPVQPTAPSIQSLPPADPPFVSYLS